MKKRKYCRGSAFLLAAVVGLALAGCGSPVRSTGRMPDSTGTDRETGGAGAGDDAGQKTTVESEENVASQEYLSEDGAYKIILPEGLTQTNVRVQAGTVMINLEGGSERDGFSGIFLACAKSNVMGNPSVMESLEDYADHMMWLLLTDSGVTVNWEDTDAPAAEGFERCFAREGAAKGSFRGQAYGYYAESASVYAGIFLIGSGDDIEEAKQVLALELLDESAGMAGTRSFIDSMTAILDHINGGSLRETYKAMVDMGGTEDELEYFESQAIQVLSEQWGIEDSSSLWEMADSLILGGHNPNALKFLEEYGGTEETDRGAFEAKLREQDLDEETCICLLAAYDAWSAYGEGAIAAWDLSRVGTIMGFGYAAGYCTYEEAMDKTLEAAEKAQELFDSWEDFNQSYLYGYSYWSGESLENSESSAAERAELVYSMEALENGPFAVDWSMELKKEW